jgi:hypothetical protein
MPVSSYFYPRITYGAINLDFDEPAEVVIPRPRAMRGQQISYAGVSETLLTRMEYFVALRFNFVRATKVTEVLTWWRDHAVLGKPSALVLDRFTLQTPGAPTVTVMGTGGTTTYGYKVTAESAIGQTLPSPETQISNGNNDLTTSNFNRITWTAVPRATGYRVYRTTTTSTVETTTGLIGTTTGTQFDDTGIVASGSPPTQAAGVGRQWEGSWNEFFTQAELVGDNLDVLRPRLTRAIYGLELVFRQGTTP